MRASLAHRRWRSLAHCRPLLLLGRLTLGYYRLAKLLVPQNILGRALACLALAVAPCRAYSVLSHEALVDSLWDVRIKPALLALFPQATPDQLNEAHAYAYGGAIIQDEGYYPHGNCKFSDLLHYARSADFIRALVSQSSTLDDYAFALGALAHYYGDTIGHRFGTNVAEPLLYPKLKRKFGSRVTYEEQPADHLRAEYGFDVLEVAKGNYASGQYHDFIGFEVDKPLLERAFRQTYGFEVSDMFRDFDLSLGSYRRAVSKYIPFFTRVAWAGHAGEIRKAHPGITRRQFVFIMKRSSYEHYWGKKYEHPSAWDDFVAFLVKLLPPLGPIRTLKFKALTPQAEQIFMRSFDMAAPAYGNAIRQAAARRWNAENVNFDLGVPQPAGKYKLQDEAYAYWVEMLARSNFRGASPEISAEILAYYHDLSAPIATKKHRKEWSRLLDNLQALRQAAAGRLSAGS
jgi:hypothetical protein